MVNRLCLMVLESTMGGKLLFRIMLSIVLVCAFVEISETASAQEKSIIISYKFLRPHTLFIGVCATCLVCARRIQKEAESRDGLTGLINKRCVMDRMVRRRCLSKRKRLVVFFLDMDGLKRINDNFSHIAGDRAIVTTVNSIKAVLRKNDVLFRYGGDEFVVVALFDSETVENEVSAFAKRIQDVVSSAEFVYNNAKIPLSVSIGWSIVEFGVSAKEIIALADERMYAAKRAKKMQVQCHG